MRHALADNCSPRLSPRRLFAPLAAALLAALALSAGTARACSCMQQTPQQAFEQAAAVFEGYVVEVRPNVLAEGHAPQRAVHMKLVRTWKGTPPTAEALELTTPGDSAACGYAFEPGRSYLVYAAADTGAQPGALSVSLCSRTQLIDQAGEDLKLLGMGSTPVDPKAESPVPDQPAKTQGAPGKQPPAQGGCAGCSTLGAVPRSRAVGPLLLAASVLALTCRRRSGSRS